LWYVNGKQHRLDGHAADFIQICGINQKMPKFCIFPGKVHRPAFEHADGTKYWYVNGILHRTDGGPLLSTKMEQNLGM
jgi:hypothetical protein